MIVSGGRRAAPGAAAGERCATAARGTRSGGGRGAGARNRERTQLPDKLERLGVRTLGELAALPAAAVADRFGEPGLRALRLAAGPTSRCAPVARTRRSSRLGLPEAASGPQLERALELLIDRLLAHPARRGTHAAPAAARARLAGGGGWRSEVALRSAGADAERLRLALVPRLGELPGPAAWLGLRALELGPRAATRPRWPAPGRGAPRAARRGGAPGARGRRARRGAAGARGRPGSRVPERRAILTPFSERVAELGPGLLAAPGAGRGQPTDGVPGDGRRRGGGGGARGVAGRGPLVDAEPAAPPLLRARPRRRPQRGRLPRAAPTAALVRAAGVKRCAATAALRRAPRPLRVLVPRRRFLPEELAAAAAELRLPAFALTDHDGIWGAMEFAQACKGLGVKRDHRRRADARRRLAPHSAGRGPRPASATSAGC